MLCPDPPRLSCRPSLFVVTDGAGFGRGRLVPFYDCSAGVTGLFGGTAGFRSQSADGGTFLPDDSPYVLGPVSLNDNMARGIQTVAQPRRLTLRIRLKQG